MIMVTVQVADLSHENSSQVKSRGGDLVDFQVILVPSQVVKTNPSDSHVYHAGHFFQLSFFVSRSGLVELGFSIRVVLQCRVSFHHKKASIVFHKNFHGR